MDQKPEIQYVGQFYVYGSEVQAEKKKQQKKNQLPKIPKPTREHYIYIDPAAVCGIAVAAVMLVVLIVVAGVELVRVYGRLQEAKNQQETVSQQLLQQQQENEALKSDLDKADDPEFIKGLARDQLGLVEDGERIFYDVND